VEEEEEEEVCRFWQWDGGGWREDVWLRRLWLRVGHEGSFGGDGCEAVMPGVGTGVLTC
jgi:hypothetical protein